MAHTDHLSEVYMYQQLLQKRGMGVKNKEMGGANRFLRFPWMTQY